MTITAVKQQPSGLWLITDDAGTIYATKSQFKAALADRARETHAAVSILSVRGWYYRELKRLSIVDSKEQCA